MPALHHQPEAQALEELSRMSIAQQYVYEEVIAQKTEAIEGYNFWTASCRGYDVDENEVACIFELAARFENNNLPRHHMPER